MSPLAVSTVQSWAVNVSYAVPEPGAAALLADSQWRGFPNLLPLPFDAATLRAFLNHHPCGLPPETRWLCPLFPVIPKLN